METELKFALSPDARRALEHGPLRDAAGDAQVHSNHTTYFDTPDLALHKAGFSLRVRRRPESGESVQTVKAVGIGSGLRRQEWQWPIAGETPELKTLQDVPGLPTVLNADGGALRPLFRTEVCRHKWILRPQPGSAVEIALDEGMIIAGNHREHISELEMELKEGPEEALFRLGLDFERIASLPLQLESKGARGYRLQGGERPAAHQAEPIAFGATATVAEVFGLVADALVEELLANQPATLRGEEEGGVHHMRVSARRLRSLLVLFSPLLESRARVRFDMALQHVAALLGSARDWDVFVTETLPQAAAEGIDVAWIKRLHIAAEIRRHAAHQAAKKAVGQSEFTRFVLAFRTWSQSGRSALATDRRDDRMAASAAFLLDIVERQLRRRLDRSDARDGASLHAVRKSAKKLRYSVDYFSSLYGSDARRYSGRCEALQKKLGAVNDLETASARAAELTDNGRLDLVPALGLLACWASRRRPRLAAKAAKACARFAHEKPFWS